MRKREKRQKIKDPIFIDQVHSQITKESQPFQCPTQNT